MAEKPSYTQLEFWLLELKTAVAEKSSLADKPEFRAVLEGDHEALHELGLARLATAFLDLFTGITPERFNAKVQSFFANDLTQLAHDAVSGGADAIGMAGGDGSLGLVAAVAVERDVPFFCIPVGTRNHFALDLGLNRDDPISALAALEKGEEILIDYALANGRTFLNNMSFGVYAQAVHKEEYRAQKASTLAEVVGEVALKRESQAKLRYVTPDGQRHEHAPLLLISNNLYKYSGYPDYGRRSGWIRASWEWVR